MIKLKLKINDECAVEMMNAKDDCMEGYPWVKVTCDRGEVDEPCWVECQRRHGYIAKAWCHNPSPAFPNYEVCFCSWPCLNLSPH